MVKRIENLTEAQKARIPEWRDKWIEIGLRTGETEWEAAESALKVCYEKTGIKWHNNVVRVSSPLVGAIASSLAMKILTNDAVDDAVRGDVRVAVDDAVRGSVHDAVRDAVGGAVRGSVINAVRVAVDDAVRGSVHGAVGDAVHGYVDGAVRGAVSGAVSGAVGRAVSEAVHGTVRGAVRDAVRGAVSGAVGRAVSEAVRGTVRGFKWHYWLGGQFWVGESYGSPSFVSFFLDVCDLEFNADIYKRARAYQALCESVNYIWPNRAFAMICARPSHIYRDDQGRLHHETKKTIQYPDGWGLYCIHGVTVHDWIIEAPERISVDTIKNETNLEIQRIMIERYGVDKYLIETGANVIDADMRGIEGGGARALIREDNGQKWLICTDGSTERVYHLAVSRNATTCKQAHEELCGFNEQKIKMEG